MRLTRETKRRGSIVVPRLFRWAPALGVLFLFAGTARPAHGQVWVDASQLNGKLPDWVDPAYVKPMPEHHDPCVVFHRWCEPVYRTVCRHVWHEPVVRVTCEQVWVPPRYEWRDCGCELQWGRALVLVEPGHYVTCQHEVVVTPGCWETVEIRELVSEGHFED